MEAIIFANQRQAKVPKLTANVAQVGKWKNLPKLVVIGACIKK